MQGKGQHTLITVGAFDLAEITRFGTISTEMAHFVTVPTRDSCRVARFVTFLAHVTFFSTITTVVSPTGRAVLREMSHCKLSE